MGSIGVRFAVAASTTTVASISFDSGFESSACTNSGKIRFIAEVVVRETLNSGSPSSGSSAATNSGKIRFALESLLETGRSAGAVFFAAGGFPVIPKTTSYSPK